MMMKGQTKLSKKLDDRLSATIKRMKDVSKDIFKKGTLVTTGNERENFESTLRAYCNLNICSEEDYEFIGSSLFTQQMCDNLLLEAGISCIKPKHSVLLMSSYFQSWLKSSAVSFIKARRVGESFKYNTAPYTVLVEATSSFNYLPTIIIPVNMDLHWGYLIVLPDANTSSAVIMWGDSLGVTPPEGLMETFRAYLMLLFRSVRFSISWTNHTLEVLRFMRQEDSYSCGFYVLAAMASFANGFGDDEFPRQDYRVYDRSVTENYRTACVRNLVRHILKEKHNPGVFEIFASVKEECRLIRERANRNCPPMYAEIAEEKRSLLCREDTCTAQEAVHDVDGEDKNNLHQSGLVSEFAISPRPFVRTVRLSHHKEVLSFTELVDVRTVILQAEEVATKSVESVKLNKEEEQRSLCHKHENPGVIEAEIVKNAKTEPVEERARKRVSLRGDDDHSAQVVDLSDPEANLTIVEDFSNIFAYLAVRLLEGHLLRKPEYLMYKNSAFVLRLRMRCRLYDPPPKWNKPLSQYKRCPVRLYARLFKSGGWRMTFRHQHNHRIWSNATPSPAEVRKRLLSMRSSLGKLYWNASAEHRAWIDGLRHIGQRCPAISGTWTPSRKDDFESDVFKVENKEHGEDLRERDSRSYIDILPRSEAIQDVRDLVTPLDTPGLPLARPRVGERETEDLIPMRIEVEEILKKYIQGCVVTMDGKDLKKEIQHMSECFGFPMIVRNSYYYQDESDPPQQHGPVQVQKIVFKCTFGARSNQRKKCHHQFSVLSRARLYLKAGDGNDKDRDKCLNRPFVINFSETWHNHKADVEYLRKCLPPQVWKEAVHLRDKSLISTGDIVRNIEDRYNLNVDRKALARRLRWETRKRHPVERDCQELISNLFKFARIYPGMFVEARVVDDNALHSVCWGFPKWLQDYKQFGVVPGVSIDAKAIANNYDTPLAFIGGRTNNGKITIFFMGFLATQREEEFVWFLQQFREFVRVAPRFVSSDQDAAIITSVEKVFPTTVVILDDWHLNQNQTKNTGVYAKKRGQGSLGTEMNAALHELRRSSDLLQFLERRRRFEERFFSDGDIPRWFRSLYYTYYKLVVSGFNRTTSGERFLFQGTGYVESANSQYQRVIMQKKVPMSRVPEEMLRYTEEKVQERTRDLRTIKYLDHMSLVSVAQFGFDTETWEAVVQRCTSFALGRFFQFSVTATHHYTVPRCEVVHGVYGETLFFSVSAGTTEKGNLRSYQVLSPRNWNADMYLPGMCSCQWSQSTGLPCRHAARVATVFREFSVTSGRFPLECMFHPYWRKDRKGWKDEDIIRSRLGTLNPTAIDAEEDAACEEEEQEERRLDRMRTVMWCNGNSTWNQLHQRVSKKGINAMRKLDRVMSLLLQEVTRNREQEDLNIALVTRRLMEAVEAECGASSQPRKLDIKQATTEGNVKNSSQGAVKGRGTKKRARSWTEAGEKNKKNKGKRKTEEDKASQPAKVTFSQATIKP